MNGQFLEATEKKVDWTHVDEVTFMCFWRYAYTGDYSIQNADVPPECSAQGSIMEASTDGLFLTSTGIFAASAADLPSVMNTEPEPEPAPEPVAVVEDDWGAFTPSKKKKSRIVRPPPTKQENLWSKFTLLRKQGGDPNTVEKKGNQRTHLLLHAKVCAFADCYGILPLTKVSYNHVHQSLVDMKHASALTEFVALARFCYESLVPDDLKNLVVAFSACEIERLWDTAFSRFVGSTW